MIATALGLMVLTARVSGSDTPDPSSVTVTGSLQSEIGCPGDFSPSCALTNLAFDASDAVWQGSWSLPAGSFQYLAALNGTFDEVYGANATRSGSSISLTLGGTTTVKFYYDHETHWITDNQNSVIATVPGSFQSELGCAGDFDPSCLRSWLQDPDGDGIYAFSTASLPPGDYSAKVAIDESFTENYGVGGVLNGPNILFSVGPGDTVRFVYDPVTHILTITSRPALPPPHPSPAFGPIGLACAILLLLAVARAAIPPRSARARLSPPSTRRPTALTR